MRPDNIERNKLCRKNLTGKKFGMLLVLEEDGRTKTNASTYKCQCDCGNIKNKALSYNLSRGNLESCGCLTRERLTKRNLENRKNLVGQKFGRLLVIEEDGKDYHGFTYKCQCDCGNIKEKSKTNSLTRGHLKSCGCILEENKSTFEKTKIRIRENSIEVNGCWEWKKFIMKTGYAQTKFHGKCVTAHRLSYKCFHGEIPDGMCILHKCDNMKCVNPSHLFLGTHQDNSDDMVKKARQRKQSSLCENDILDIRKSHPSCTIADLAKIYEISYASIKKIIHRITWKHI